MTVTNKQISDAIDTGIQAASSQGVPDWLGATDALIDLLVENGECFSSGEIAAHLRTFRPELVFSVTNSLGEHIRDRFYSNTLPMYENPDGTHTPVEQIPRMTQGFTRTPAGTQVFVYGPDFDECQDHEFEVDIPKPGTQIPAAPGDAHGLPARPQQPPKPVQHFTTLTPKPSPRDLTATIHNDGRCCIPRSAVEALLHDTGTGLKGGDSMYVKVDDGAEEARIALDREDGAQGYQLAASRGRVLFPHPAHPFTPGDSYAIRIDGTNRRLIVDLSATL
jgi:hypothetical protein